MPLNFLAGKEVKSMELIAQAHSLGVGEANFHLQFTPKYLSARRLPRRRRE